MLDSGPRVPVLCIGDEGNIRPIKADDLTVTFLGAKEGGYEALPIRH